MKEKVLATKGPRQHGKYDADLKAGAVFGRLTSLGLVRSSNKQREYLFVCSCGEVVWHSGSEVVKSRSLSCGCYAREAAAARCKGREKHGLSKTPIYNIWHCMMDRCYKPTNKAYRFYGARGISVCERWHSFEQFFADIEPIWASGLQIDRVDTYGNYEIDNVRFITAKENQRNRRDNTLVTIDGVTRCISEWAEIAGIKATLFQQRITRDNMDPKQALTYKNYKEDEHGHMRKQRKINRAESREFPEGPEQPEQCELPEISRQQGSKELPCCTAG